MSNLDLNDWEFADDEEARAVHRLFESEGFRFLGKYDSRCWLGWRPASDGPTSFQ